MVFAATALVAVSGCVSAEPTPEPSDGGITGVQTYGDLTRDHTDDTVAYPQSPPVGGDHNNEWVDCTGTVYDQEVPNGKAVHALEHGAVWVTYTDAVTIQRCRSVGGQGRRSAVLVHEPVRRPGVPDHSDGMGCSAWRRRCQ